MEAYQTYKYKDHVAHIFLLSTNDIMLRSEKHRSVLTVRDTVKIQYDGT